MGLFDKLKKSLAKTKESINEKFNTVLKTFKLRQAAKEKKLRDSYELKSELNKIMSDILTEGSGSKIELQGTPAVIMVIGVNGVGKTTSIGKIANMYRNQGKSVLIAAADTFRAAAIEQLEVWSERAGVDIIKQQEGSDPAAVIYDAVNAAKSRNIDILLCDTAGRLHNKKNLMEELKKIKSVIDKKAPDALRECMLVLDANTGQNGLQQAKVFTEAVNLTSVTLTKLDGSAKGAIVLAVAKEMKLPVKLIGVGEKMEDLKSFNSEEFIEAIFE